MADLTEIVEQLAQAAQPGRPEKPPEKPSSAAEFRLNRTPLVRLPSGNVMRLKRVGIFDLIEQGQIPQSLSTQAAAVAGPGLKTMTEDQIRQYIGVVNLVVCACADDPPVKMRPEEGVAEEAGALYVDELTFFDREAIFKWGCGLANRLQVFQSQPLATVPDTPDQ